MAPKPKPSNHCRTVAVLAGVSSGAGAASASVHVATSGLSARKAASMPAKLGRCAGLAAQHACTSRAHNSGHADGSSGRASLVAIHIGMCVSMVLLCRSKCGKPVYTRFCVNSSQRMSPNENMSDAASGRPCQASGAMYSGVPTGSTASSRASDSPMPKSAIFRTHSPSARRFFIRILPGLRSQCRCPLAWM